MTQKCELPNDKSAVSEKSCSREITRKEFIDTVVKRAALAGGLAVGYKVVDRFLVPPAYAQTSQSNQLPSQNSNLNSVSDSIPSLPGST
jgi:hypothetical protein